MAHPGFSEEKLIDNPNPNAKIGFVVFYPFQFYVFKNVYKHLSEDAEFIVDGGYYLPRPQPDEVLEEMVSFLSKKEVYFRILYSRDYLNSGYLKRFSSKYGLLVSLWYSGCVSLPCNKNRKKAHMNYGAGKELAIFHTRNRKWDLYLCFSDYIYKIIKLFTDAKIVGYPKFDDWFNNELDEKFIDEVRSKIVPSKKTILYLPTHSDLSSVDALAFELKKLTLDYNVIVKFHYHTPREEKWRMEKLRHKNIIAFKDDIDLLPLLKVADVVISDNSSAIFDAILADKPVAATDFVSDEYLDAGHKKMRIFPLRSPEGAHTYSQSIEQRIKKDGSVVTLKKPEELSAAVETALTDSKLIRDSRKKLRNELFAFNDGKCGKRAAEALRELLLAEKLPEKPILYHVIEADASWDRSFYYYMNIKGPLGLKNVKHGFGFFGSQSVVRSSKRNYYKEFLNIKSLPFHRRIAAVLKAFFLQ